MELLEIRTRISEMKMMLGGVKIQSGTAKERTHEFEDIATDLSQLKHWQKYINRALVTCEAVSGVYSIYKWSPRNKKGQGGGSKEGKDRNSWRYNLEKYFRFNENYKPKRSRSSMNPKQDKQKHIRAYHIQMTKPEIKKNIFSR